MCHARAEVVLAASSLNTPKLLMLSGIGPAAHLAEHGIALRADRAGVGQNLQDHLELYLQYAASQPITLFKYWNLLGKAWVGAQWLLARKGPRRIEPVRGLRLHPLARGRDYPDIQYHFLPIAVRYDGQAVAEGHGFQTHVGPMRSASRGWVKLASPRPEDAPRICFQLHERPAGLGGFPHLHPADARDHGAGAFAPYLKHEIQPGAMCRTDAALDAFIRDHVESAYHPCGTARMGRRDDPRAVVDPHGRVIGVDGLRVADSSIFPRIPNGNLNAPSIMVGEKIADHILGRSLPPMNLEPWVHPDWQQAQR